MQEEYVSSISTVVSIFCTPFFSTNVIFIGNNGGNFISISFHLQKFILFMYFINYSKLCCVDDKCYVMYLKNIRCKIILIFSK